MKSKFIHPAVFTLIGLLIFVTCDDQNPVDSEDSTTSGTAEKFNLTLASTPMAVDSLGNQVVVGEDFAGTTSGTPYTYLKASLVDTAGTVLKNQLISFSATVTGSEFGSFDLSSNYTNDNGDATVIFYDGGSAAYDNAVTQVYEGVVVTATFITTVGSTEETVTATAKFDVYDTSAVSLWPYHVLLSSDVESIKLDGGETRAGLSAKVLSKQNSVPLLGADVYFSTPTGAGGFTSIYELTDTSEYAKTEFFDTGSPSEAGPVTIVAGYNHPSFGTVWDSVQISIIDTAYSGVPAYIEIPPAYPGEIMIVGGGGTESTDISAHVYDENGVLVNEPISVQFTLGPNIPSGANINDVGISDSAYTSDGVAKVSLNSGTAPGPVRITAEVSYDTVTISATAVPVIVVTGPAFYIYPDYDFNNVNPIGGGFYQMEAAAIVYDRWNNPVADSTYVYWTLTPSPDDIDGIVYAQITGTSFTGNASLNDETYSGVAYTTIVYPSHDFFSDAIITALCYGDDINGDGVYGDTVSASIENNVVMPYYEGSNGVLQLYVSTTYYDFTVSGSPALVTATARLLDHYSNPVKDARILFNGTGATSYSEYGESHSDDGHFPNNTGAGNGCFDWLDVNENDFHDSSETYHETYTDSDENAVWTGYSHIQDCGTPIVKTDSDGYTRVVMSFAQDICTPIPNSDPQQYNEFTATVTAILLDPVSISADPVQISFIRSWDGNALSKTKEIGTE